jgi:tetratricopeptide (TPR) repeat protein
MNSAHARFRCGLILAGIVLLAPAVVAAQGGSINGNTLLPNGALLNERARITLRTDRGVKSNVYTDNQGHFQFSGLTPGVYELIVEPDGDRFETAKARIEVFPNAPALVNVNLREKKVSESRLAGNVVSAGELDSAIPASAKREFERASEANKSGRTADAIAHLRKAIAIYPAYLMAHNDLGAQLLSQGKLDEAAEEFQRALEIDPKAFNPRLNLGIVLVQEHRFAEATGMLRTALALQPGSAAARLYDGLALEGSGDLSGAEQELRTAHDVGGTAYATALFHLGRVYVSQGERERARKMFEGYLREAPNGSDAAEARKMISMLR